MDLGTMRRNSGDVAAVYRKHGSLNRKYRDTETNSSFDCETIGLHLGHGADSRIPVAH